MSDPRIPKGFTITYHENRGYDSPDRWYEARHGGKLLYSGDFDEALAAVLAEAKKQTSFRRNRRSGRVIDADAGAVVLVLPCRRKVQLSLHGPGGNASVYLSAVAAALLAKKLVARSNRIANGRRRS